MPAQEVWTESDPRKEGQGKEDVLLLIRKVQTPTRVTAPETHKQLGFALHSMSKKSTKNNYKVLWHNNFSSFIFPVDQHLLASLSTTPLAIATRDGLAWLVAGGRQAGQVCTGSKLLFILKGCLTIESKPLLTSSNKLLTTRDFLLSVELKSSCGSF